MHAAESAKAALHYTPNQSVIDKYEQRQGEIKVARGKVEAKEKKLAKIMTDIETIRGPWYTKVIDLIAKISEGFSISFEKIGCAGEVKLGEHEDYDKWCIEILVKFRYGIVVDLYDTIVGSERTHGLIDSYYLSSYVHRDAEKLQKLTGQRQSGGVRTFVRHCV